MANPAVASAINEFSANFMKLYESGQLKAVAELHTEDCRILAPGKELHQGRAFILKALEAIKSSGVAKIVIKSDEIGGSGDVAYESGESTFLKDDGTVTETRRNLVVFKKVGGAYLMHSVCFNYKK